MIENTNDINWEKTYSDKQTKYKKLRKKLKKSFQKQSRLPAQAEYL